MSSALNRREEVWLRAWLEALAACSRNPASGEAGLVLLTADQCLKQFDKRFKPETCETCGGRPEHCHDCTGTNNHWRPRK